MTLEVRVSDLAQALYAQLGFSRQGGADTTDTGEDAW